MDESKISQSVFGNQDAVMDGELPDLLHADVRLGTGLSWDSAAERAAAMYDVKAVPADQVIVGPEGDVYWKGVTADVDVN